MSMKYGTHCQRCYAHIPFNRSVCPLGGKLTCAADVQWIESRLSTAGSCFLSI